jgi:hypothetical protein
MGSSSTGILAYGVDLGSDDKGWKLENLGEYGEPPVVDWWTHDEESDEDDGGFVDALILKLYQSLGLPDVDAWEAQRLLKSEAGLELVTYGHHDYPGYILATAKHEAGGWGAEELPSLVVPTADLLAWKHQLRMAFEKTGLIPTSPDGWILTSSYG